MNIKNKNKKEDFDDKVSERFEVLDKIGKGTFGTVYKALDKSTNTIVAIKRTFDVLNSKAESERLLRELTLINSFEEHPNIIKIYNVKKSENSKDLYLIYEYFPANLYTVIRAKILTSQHIKFITYQLLKILKYIHSAGIIHRNLKPSNILITPECQIKLDDFSLAKSIITKEDDYLSNITDYIAIRWYRAPEILLGAEYVENTEDHEIKENIVDVENKANIVDGEITEVVEKMENTDIGENERLENHNYEESDEKKTKSQTSSNKNSDYKYAEYCKKVDLWSVGCILGEMLCGKTVFPGSSTINQLNLITQLVGFPTPEDLDQIKLSLTGLLESIKLLQKIDVKSYLYDGVGDFKDTNSNCNNGNRFKKMFPDAEDDALDLLTKLLVFNPYKRITVEEALEHPFVKDFRNIEEEIICNQKIELRLTDEFIQEVLIYKKKMEKDEACDSHTNSVYITEYKDRKFSKDGKNKTKFSEEKKI
jgi:mitogen-activated protein kinase 15